MKVNLGGGWVEGGDRVIRTAIIDSPEFIGGDATYDFGGNRIHVFTETGASTLTCVKPGTVRCIVVGGGATGGSGNTNRGGGGGAGKVIDGTFFADDDFSVLVAPGVTGSAGLDGTRGNYSTAGPFIAMGGGAANVGQFSDPNGDDGGSGGGGCGTTTTGQPGKAIANATNPNIQTHGFNGGSGFPNGTATARGGGGGGGAGGPGVSGSNAIGGDGGPSIDLSSLLGTTYGDAGRFAAGGGGSGTTPGAGGTGGGGAGNGGNPTSPGSGGGGTSGNAVPGAGFKGIVFVLYPIPT